MQVMGSDSGGNEARTARPPHASAAKRFRATGQAYLPEFHDDYKRRFGKPARHAFNVQRALPDLAGLDALSTLQEERRVSKNLTLAQQWILYVLGDTTGTAGCVAIRSWCMSTRTGRSRSGMRDACSSTARTPRTRRAFVNELPEQDTRATTPLCSRTAFRSRRGRYP
jgi:hypothetical protein